jgi:hypothetical protein
MIPTCGPRQRASCRLPALLALAAVLALATLLVTPASGVGADPAHGRPFPLEIPAERLTADFWIGRAAGCEQVLLTPPTVAGQNGRVIAAGPGLHDPAALPARLPRAMVTHLVEGLAAGNRARPVIDGAEAAAADLTATLALANVTLVAFVCRRFLAVNHVTGLLPTLFLMPIVMPRIQQGLGVIEADAMQRNEKTK